MNHRSLILAFAVAAFAAGSMAHAEVLLMDRVKQEHAMNSSNRSACNNSNYGNARN